MNLLDYLLPFVLALGVLIVVHEFGHYWVARRCGVKVLRFSVGFGKPLLARRCGRDGTEWVLAAFPLGGYVKMLDEREAPVEGHELHRAFNRQPVGKRIAIVAAGPLANLLLAVLLYWGLNVAGVDEMRARVALVEGPSVARAAGLDEGDLVTSIDGQAVRSWPELRWALLHEAIDGRTVELGLQRLDGSAKRVRMDLSGFNLEDGRTDPLLVLGLQPFRPKIVPIVGQLAAGGAAERAGVRPGDRILAIDAAPIGDWSELVAYLRDKAGRSLNVTIERGGERFTLAIVPAAENVGGQTIGRIGIVVAQPPGEDAAMFVEVRYGLLEGLSQAVRHTWETSALSLSVMGRMITGDVSWKNLSGPGTIAYYAGQSASMGLEPYLKFIALISISLGVLNLLPIPVLDGGHLLYYAVELIKGGPIPERIMEIGQQIGLALLVMLMAFAFYNDIHRLLSG